MTHQLTAAELAEQEERMIKAHKLIKERETRELAASVKYYRKAQDKSEDDNVN